ncbi:murein biosynthesis integral membrane protein MurJ [Gorillibacterium timonense]|uniref:murein biosynthesis integral membrane protein MurJ n=1 Tax=Gorillibacterium timonense TaxID=1689269 RepID=UPI00071C9437|nr:murein biosynthesis integral membrane protein MurJ [Gorillibacterium timonense]
MNARRAGSAPKRFRSPAGSGAASAGSAAAGVAAALTESATPPTALAEAAALAAPAGPAAAAAKPKSAGSSMSALFLVTILLAVVAKLSGLIREMVIGYYYGASAELDLYYYLNTLPELFSTGITAAVAVALIPFLYGKEDSRYGENRVIVSQVLIAGTLFFGLVTAAAIVFHQPVLEVLLAGSKMPMANAPALLAVASLQMVPTFLSAILLAVETKLEKFKTITLLSLPLNLAAVVAQIVLHHRTGVLSVGIGLLVGTVLQTAYLFYDLHRQGQRYKAVLAPAAYRGPEFREFLLFLIPVYLGTMIQRAGVFVDRRLASGLAEGSISALSYADRVIQMIVMIIVSTIGMILFSKMSSIDEQDEEGMVELLGGAITFSCLTILPVTAFLLVFSPEVIALLFGRGKFDANGLHLTSQALAGYGIGLLGIGMRYILNRVYFAKRDARTPTINTLNAFVVGVILSIVLCRYFGVTGIALAASLTMMLSSLLLAYRLERRYRFLSRIDWGDAAKSAALSVLLGAVWFAIRELVPASPAMKLLAALPAGVLVFAACAKLFGIRDWVKLEAALKAKLSSKRRSIG